MTWRRGSSEQAIWLQYGDFADGAEDVLLTLSRRRDAENVEIQLRLRHLDGSAAAGAELPRYAEFSFDNGAASTAYAGGVGFIAAADDGRIYFTTGQGRYDKDLSPFRSIVDGIENEFGIVVDGEAFDFQIDPPNRDTLAMLFAVGDPEESD